MDALIIDLSDNAHGWEGDATAEVVKAAKSAGLSVTQRSGKAINLLKEPRSAAIDANGIVVVLAHGRRADPVDFVDLGIQAGGPADRQTIHLNSYYLLDQLLAVLGATPPFHLLLVVCEGMNSDAVAVFSFGVDVLTVTSSTEKISAANASRFAVELFKEIVAARADAGALPAEVARVVQWVEQHSQAGGSTVRWTGAPGNAVIVAAPQSVPAARDRA